jgi:hypothetical protein
MLKVSKVRPIAMAAQFRARNVFARSNIGIVGSKRTRGTDYVYAFCVCVALRRQGPCDGLIHCPMSLTNCL